MKIVLVSCVNTVYICIGLKLFFLMCDEVINENMYSHGRVTSLVA
jgi:hypothetical protein